MANDIVRSVDGTTIAYETFGQGPTLIAVCGATCDRALMRPTAQALGEQFTTINYDRRGRGDGDVVPRHGHARRGGRGAARIRHVAGPARRRPDAGLRLGRDG